MCNTAEINHSESIVLQCSWEDWRTAAVNCHFWQFDSLFDNLFPIFADFVAWFVIWSDLCSLFFLLTLFSFSPDFSNGVRAL